MQIEVSTDNSVVGSEALVAQVEAVVTDALDRFSDRLTRVEVHLGDESAGRSTPSDMRCMIEARPAGMQPIAVSESAATSDAALSGAVHKMQRALESDFGRLDRRRSR